MRTVCFREVGPSGPLHSRSPKHSHLAGCQLPGSQSKVRSSRRAGVNCGLCVKASATNSTRSYQLNCLVWGVKHCTPTSGVDSTCSGCIAGMTRVIIPKRNLPDVKADLPAAVRDVLQIILAERLEEVRQGLVMHCPC